MSRIIAFSGSNSSKSINSRLIAYLASKYDEIEVLDLRDYPLPLYSMDIEEEEGIPESVHKLIGILQKADGCIISTPEHNGLVSAFYKSIYDWMSRTDIKYLEDTPTLLLSTSPGRGGAAKALATVDGLMDRTGANVIDTYSLPSFNHTFDSEKMEIIDEDHRKNIHNRVEKLLEIVVKG